MSEEIFQKLTNSTEYYKSKGQNLVTSIQLVETQLQGDKNKEEKLKLLGQIYKSHENSWVIVQQPIPTNSIIHCDIDQNFKQIVASYGDGSILLIDACTFQTIQNITQGLKYQCCAYFSQDDKFIYCLTGKLLQVWLRIAKYCKLQFSFAAFPLGIQEITNNHGSLFLKQKNEFLIQWNCWGKKQVSKYVQKIPDEIFRTPKRIQLHTLTISKDSKFIASIDMNIKIICNSTKEIILSQEGHNGQGISIKFSNDGLSLATSYEDRIIKIWSLSQAKSIQLVKQINYSAVEPIIMGFTKFDHHLIVKSQNTIIIAGVKTKIIEDYWVAQQSYGYGKRGVLLFDLSYNLSLIRQK